MPYYDSHVKVYHGPRRGGKTASATGDGAIALLNSQNVFSNYPIDFWFKENEESETKHYKSEPLLLEELLRIDDPEVQNKYRRSLCIWDETALSLYSRNSQAVVNKMYGLIITLIGKLELSFDFTTQFISLLDKNIRIQEDALIFCSDLSFKYPHLQRGSVISQIWQDISGRYTGEMYEYSNQTYQQTFYDKWVWNIYDTLGTFDILKAQEKITWDQLRENVSEYEYTDNEANIEILKHLINEYEAMEQYKIPQPIMYRAAKTRGFSGKAADMGQLLMEVGVKLYGTNMWDIRPFLEKVLV